jgi:hypothetical protein
MPASPPPTPAPREFHEAVEYVKGLYGTDASIARLILDIDRETRKRAIAEGKDFGDAVRKAVGNTSNPLKIEAIWQAAQIR